MAQRTPNQGGRFTAACGTRTARREMRVVASRIAQGRMHAARRAKRREAGENRTCDLKVHRAGIPGYDRALAAMLKP
jgi:hypothetical protein